jgi:hypothetical protein
MGLDQATSQVFFLGLFYPFMRKSRYHVETDHSPFLFHLFHSEYNHWLTLNNSLTVDATSLRNLGSNKNELKSKFVLIDIYHALRGLIINFANSPLCACRSSSGQKHQYGLMTLAYQRFTAVLLLIYDSLFLSGIYYCLSVFWCLASRQCTFPHGTVCEGAFS